MVTFEIHDLNVWFGSVSAVRDVNIEIEANEILSIIGPSNSGKTTFLRTLNAIPLRLRRSFGLAALFSFSPTVAGMGPVHRLIRGP